MAESKGLKEIQVAHDAVVVDLKAPVIIERDGQPIAVVLSFEEYCRLRDMVLTEHQRRQAAWAKLNALLEEVHSRPTDLTPEEIEAEITAAREEVKEMHHARSSGR